MIRRTFDNYSINVIHTYTVPVIVEATTSIGYVRERRTNNAPDIVVAESAGRC